MRPPPFPAWPVPTPATRPQPGPGPAAASVAALGHPGTGQDRRQWLALLACCAAGTAAALAARPAQAGLPDVVAASKPAVVAIGTYNALGNPRFILRGTGFVVGDGLTVVTNAHVLPEYGNPPGPLPGTPPEAPASATPAPLGETRLVLHVPGTRRSSQEQGDIRNLRQVAVDREHDLAVLRFEGAPLPGLKLAPEGTAREGQSVALIGFPLGGTLGFAHVTHRGIVSSIVPIVLPPAHTSQLTAAAVARIRQGVFDILQLDATAYPGNSGGPLIDTETGQVIGVINMVVVKGTRESALSAPSGISYAVPVKWLHALLARR